MPLLLGMVLCVSCLWFTVFGHPLVCASLSRGFNLGFLSLVNSAGRGRSSVEAWCNTALEIEEALVRTVDHHVHLYVTDLI